MKYYLISLQITMRNSTHIRLLSVKLPRNTCMRRYCTRCLHWRCMTYHQRTYNCNSYRFLILKWQMHKNCHLSCRMFLFVMIKEWTKHILLIDWMKIVYSSVVECPNQHGVVLCCHGSLFCIDWLCFTRPNIYMFYRFWCNTQIFKTTLQLSRYWPFRSLFGHFLA